MDDKKMAAWFKIGEDIGRLERAISNLNKELTAIETLKYDLIANLSDLAEEMEEGE